MESIKRFLLEERASSEAVSSVILIAFAATLLAIGLSLYYGAFNDFFTRMSTWLAGAGTSLPSWT
jgi:hypothetical protein